jgi:hypothetical protein
MKTKHYELTYTEILAIREALDHAWHENWKTLNPYSPIAKEMKQVTRALLDQFKTDVAISTP